MNDRELLGHALRSARQRKRSSIAAVATAALLSSSTLQRAEMGTVTLTGADVARLDAVLGTDGELIALFQSIAKIVRRPLFGMSRSTRQAGHRWPAEWAGPVWVLVRPFQRTLMSADLSWGPWRFQHQWDGEQLVLEDWKVPDDVSVSLHVQLSSEADIIFGTDEISTRPTNFVDLRGRWRRDA